MKISVLCLSLALTALPGMAAQAPPTHPKPTTHSATVHHPTTHRMTFDPALLHPSELKAHAPETFEATFETTKGNFVIQVTRALAPLGADRFYNLVKHGFFDGDPFFRVLPGFVVQFGLTGIPSVNKAWQNANFADEPVKERNLIGTVTFAKSSLPNSRTTQLFINLGDNSGNLDPQGFAPFGRVISGMDVVQSIYSGYGQQPDQGQIGLHGSEYFLKQYPRLDLIKSAKVTSPTPEPAHTTHSTGTTTHHATPPGHKPTQ
ncbi:MAG TPA: peptidylprolyl isomerase [Candidatus Acidoferrales bacterium]|nr:peptidylprolyl isomerase [Candidatus Acidoferrales bacterium]